MNRKRIATFVVLAAGLLFGVLFAAKIGRAPAETIVAACPPVEGYCGADVTVTDVDALNPAAFKAEFVKAGSWYELVVTTGNDSRRFGKASENRTGAVLDITAVGMLTLRSVSGEIVRTLEPSRPPELVSLQ